MILKSDNSTLRNVVNIYRGQNVEDSIKCVYYRIKITPDYNSPVRALWRGFAADFRMTNRVQWEIFFDNGDTHVSYVVYLDIIIILRYCYDLFTVSYTSYALLYC